MTEFIILVVILVALTAIFLLAFRYAKMCQQENELIN
jgi:hypothetical protein